MLEILELLGRGLIALLRLAAILEFIVHLFLGSYWLISPSYREKVKGYETYDKFAVYLGAVITAGLFIGALVFVIVR